MVSQSADGLYVMKSVVRGHHVYKRIWSLRVGQQLQLKREEDSSNDLRAVAIVEHGIVVGHLPRESATTVWFFLKRGGTASRSILWHSTC